MEGQRPSEESFRAALDAHTQLEERIGREKEPLEEEASRLRAEIDRRDDVVATSRQNLVDLSDAYQNVLRAKYAEHPETAAPHDFLVASYGLLEVIEAPGLEERFMRLLGMFPDDAVGKSLEIILGSRSSPGHSACEHRPGGEESVFITTYRAAPLTQKPEIRYAIEKPGTIVLDIGTHTVDFNGTPRDPSANLVVIPLTRILERFRNIGVGYTHYFTSVKLDGVEIYGNPTEAERAEEEARDAEMMAMLSSLTDATESHVVGETPDGTPTVIDVDAPLTAVDVPPDAATLSLEDDVNVGPGLDAPDRPQ